MKSSRRLFFYKKIMEKIYIRGKIIEGEMEFLNQYKDFLDILYYNLQ